MAIKLIIAILPIVLALALAALDFEVDTGRMLELFLPLVWGILFSVGGAIVYLNDQNFEKGKVGTKSIITLMDHTRDLCFILISHTLIFILFASLYPARTFITKVLKIQNYHIYALFADSLLFSTILIPAISSILVGMCCLLVSFRKRRFLERD